MPSLSQKLVQALNLRGMKPADLARESGVSTARISEIVTGKTKNPQLKTLKKLADALEVSVNALTGDIADRSSLSPAEQVMNPPKGTHKVNKSVGIKYCNETTKEPQLSDFALIPYYNVQASAGAGAVVQEEKVVDRFAFKEDWIRHGLGLNPNNLALISTIGDSMEPTLHPGDMILLDRSVEKIQSNSIYAIQVNGTLLVKRIQKRIDGSVIIKSDNAAYETETISSDAADALKIVGRVVWAGRRF